MELVKAVEKVDNALKFIEKPVMLITGFLLFAIMVWGVIARYMFIIPTPYQVELAKTFHIWLCFMGSSYLISIDDNPKVEFISDKIFYSKNIIFKKIYFIMIYVLSLFFLAPCLFYSVKNIPLYAMQKTVYIGYSYLWVYGGGIIGFAFMCIRCLLKIIEICAGTYFDTPMLEVKAVSESADSLSMGGEQQ